MGLFDLSKFEKISEDHKTTTLRHKDGHEIKVIHQYIPKIQREQLKFLKMADGGQVEEFEDEKYPEKADEKEHEEWLNKKDKERHKNHGKFMKNHEQMMSDGGRKKLASGGLAHYDEGTPGKTVSQDDQQAVQDQPGEMPDQSHTTNVYVNAPPNQPPPQIGPGQSMQSIQPAKVNPPQMPAQSQNLLPDKSMNAPGVAENQQQAVQTQGQIEAQKSGAQAQYEQQALKERQRLTDIDAQNYKDLKEHTDAFRGYLQANPINPNHYMESRGTGQKVANAIGLFLGGLGGGVSGTGGNVAMDYINKQIDRDIDAQKAKSEQARTIWGAYKDLYGEGNIANNLAKVSMNDMLVHQTNLTAAQLGTVSALNAAKSLGASKAVENNKLILDAAGNLRQSAPANYGAVQGNRPIPSGGSLSKTSGKGQPANEEGGQSHILKPGANNQFTFSNKNRTYDVDREEVQKQLTGASMADKAIDAINKHFPEMYANIKNVPHPSGEFGPEQMAAGPGQIVHNAGNKLADIGSDVSGYINRKAEALHGIPVVGPIITKAGTAITDTQKNRDFNVHRAAMAPAVMAVLIRSGMTPTDAETALESILPELGDTPEMAKNKLKAAIEKIKQATPTEALERHGLTRKKSK